MPDTILNRFFLTFCIVCSFACTLSAQPLSVNWRQADGLYGGHFSNLTADPFTDDLWATVSGKIYVSNDHGETWQQPESLTFRTHAFAFRSDGAIFAGRYRSYDQGLSWTHTSLPDTLSPRQLVIDEINKHVVASTRHGIYFTKDNGDTWIQTNTTNVRDLWAAGNGYLFARSYDDERQLLRSSDGGESWHLATYPGDVYILDYFQGNGNYGYLLSVFDSGTTKLFRTTDFGDTWESISNPACGPDELLGLTPDGRLIMGGPQAITILSLDFLTCTTLFEDYRRTLSPGRTTERNLNAYVLDNQGQIYVQTGFHELWRSNDSGTTWQQLSEQGINATSVNNVQVDDQSGRILTTVNFKGVFSSDDNGQQWTNRGLATPHIYDITAGDAEGEYFATPYESGLYHTTDFGANWSYIDNIDPENEYVDTYLIDIHYDAVSQILYVLSPVFDIYFSKDKGASWQAMNVPFESNIDPPITGITVTASGDLYAIIRNDILAGEHGVFRTSDLGQTWEKIDQESIPYPSWGNNYFFTDSTGRFWLTEARSLYVSSDEGVTWQLAAEAPNEIFAVEETPDGSMWIGHGTGLLRSTDNDQSWQSELTQLDNPCVLSLAWNPFTGELLAGLHQGGLYIGAIEGVERVAIEEDPDLKPRKINLSSYPNPLREAATFSFTLPEPADVRLTLYDALGREVMGLLNQQLGSGQHQVDVDLGQLSPGLYFYRLETPFGVFSKAAIRVE